LLDLVADFEVLVDSGMSPEHDIVYTRISEVHCWRYLRSTGRKEIDVSPVRSLAVLALSSYRSSHHSAYCHAPVSSSPRPSCPTQSNKYSSPPSTTIHTILAWQLNHKARFTVPTTRNVLPRKIPISRVNQHLHVQREVLLSADPVGT
jgi:hypothetical protein